MKDLTVDGLSVNSSVLETIICMAASEVDGVAAIGTTSNMTNSIMAALSARQPMAGIEADVVEETNALHVVLHIEVYYGSILPTVANSVRSVVADAIAVQLGFAVDSIDVYIDGIRF